MSYFSDVQRKLKECDDLYDGPPRDATHDEAEVFASQLKSHLEEYIDGHFAQDGEKQLLYLLGMVWSALEQAAVHGFDFDQAWARQRSSFKPDLYDLAHELLHGRKSRDEWRAEQIEAAALERLKKQKWKFESQECPGCSDETVRRMQNFWNEMVALHDNSPFWQRVWYVHNGNVQEALHEKIAEAAARAAERRD